MVLSWYVRGSPWPANDPELILRWERGDTTAIIGDALGVTKRAVIGRVGRLVKVGLLEHRINPAVVVAIQDRPKPKRKSPVMQPRVRPPPPEPRPAPGPVVILPPREPKAAYSSEDMTIRFPPFGHACQWPLGDPRSADFQFCGRVFSPHVGRPYCPDHADEAWLSRKAAA